MSGSLVRTAQRVTDAALEATVVLSFSRIGYDVRRRTEGWTPLDRLDGHGRTVVITGANSGLGLAAAKGLARAGAEVVAVVRSEEKGRATTAAVDAVSTSARPAAFETADLTDLADVRRLAVRLAARERIDALIHNAGAMFPERALTRDGLERTYQVHVVAPFLLTALLFPQLETASPSRVITVTSGGMYTERLDVAQVDTPDGYRPTVAYARAKRAQMALSGEWARRTGAAVAFEAVHPGWADTPGVADSLPRFHRLTSPVLRSPSEGADSIVWLALADLPAGEGRLWHDRRRRSAHRVPWTRARTGETTRLWDRLVRDAGADPFG